MTVGEGRNRYRRLIEEAVAEKQAAFTPKQENAA